MVRACGIAAEAREVTGWILRHPDTLDADEHVSLKDVLSPSSAPDALAGHVAGFADILTGEHGQRLDAWARRSSSRDPGSSIFRGRLGVPRVPAHFDRAQRREGFRGERLRPASDAARHARRMAC